MILFTGLPEIPGNGSNCHSEERRPHGRSWGPHGVRNQGMSSPPGTGKQCPKPKQISTAHCYHYQFNMLVKRSIRIKGNILFCLTHCITVKTVNLFGDVLVLFLASLVFKDARAGWPCASVLRKLSFCL